MKLITYTKRLYMREATIEDAELAYQLNLDPEVIKYTGDPPFIDVNEAKVFLKNYDAYEKYGIGRWYAFLKEDHDFIGWCGLKYTAATNEVDLGYRLLKKYWGKGYASELAIASIYIGFNDLELDEIVARADVENTASIRVMEKVGMEFFSVINFDGKAGVVYKLTKEKWLKS